MTVVLTAKEILAADALTIARGISAAELTERAANAALDVLEREFDTARTLVLCGRGNNGGDGFAIAAALAAKGKKVTVCYAGPLDNNGAPDTAAMSEECKRRFSLLPETVTVTNAPDLKGVSAVVDAIFGVGLSRPIEGRVAAIIERVNGSALPVLAVDIPSGVSADTGALLGTAIRAARTVSFSAYKFGHLLYPGALLCGKTTVADIGVSLPADACRLLEKADLCALPPRPPRSHKGTFGRVLVVGGSLGMSGAAHLCAKAAYRAGAGLVEIFAPEGNRVIYQIGLPEALLTLYDPENLDKTALRAAIDRADAVAIGMGLGTRETTVRLLETVLRHARVPVVLDADALNTLAAHDELRPLLAEAKAPLILTPHLGEAARLLNASVADIAGDLSLFARQLAREAGATIVLKDARTLISDGERLSLNTFGNNGMATGGSGDVLSGVIAAFLAAGSPPFKAAELGVLAHALAGDAAREHRGAHGTMASDIIEGLCEVLP